MGDGKLVCEKDDGRYEDTLDITVWNDTPMQRDIVVVIDTSKSMNEELPWLSEQVARYLPTVSPGDQVFVIGSCNGTGTKPERSRFWGKSAHSSGCCTFPKDPGLANVEFIPYQVKNGVSFDVALAFLEGTIAPKKLMVRSDAAMDFVFVTDDNAGRVGGLKADDYLTVLGNQYSDRVIRNNAFAGLTEYNRKDCRVGRENLAMEFKKVADNPTYGGKIGDLCSSNLTLFLESLTPPPTPAVLWEVMLSLEPYDPMGIEVYIGDVKVDDTYYFYDPTQQKVVINLEGLSYQPIPGNAAIVHYYGIPQS